ncbi:MAG: right-handed parallel beta-helix repeat-containing protein [Phycisphaerales bacterium]
MRHSTYLLVGGLLCAACASRQPDAAATAAKPAANVAAAPAPPRAPAQPPVPATGALPVVLVDRDDVEVRTSCTLRFAAPVADANGNGVVHVVGDGITVDLGGGTLLGCAPGTPPDRMAGTGIHVTGKRVVLRNGVVRGFRTGVLGSGCDGSLFELLDLGGNFAQRLNSNARTEDLSDWLWPHANDAGQWRAQYGAALAIERARGVFVREVMAHGGQNGIMLDRVEDSFVYDNDCSFLSGWGLSLWRSSRNTVCRNAFDFCIRGYSHGFYNRGQDSAGILCFEQSSGNLFALNSATHGGDGFFGFAGKEALGEVAAPMRIAGEAERAAWYRNRGSNFNLLVGNDFSDAAAHGIEMTFGTGNRFVGNVAERAGICGLWGGYSRASLVRGNRFVECGGPETTGERGGINIEHGSRIRVEGNTFERSGVGVRLWWDEDAGLAKTPWAQASGVLSADNVIVGNSFKDVKLPVALERTGGTVLSANHFVDCGGPVQSDEESRRTLRESSDAPAWTPEPAPAELAGAPGLVAEPDEAFLRALPGRRTPVGGRLERTGREHITMLAYGPYDFTGPRLELVSRTGARDFWRVAGVERIEAARTEGAGTFTCNIDPQTRSITVYCEVPGEVRPYRLLVSARPTGGGPSARLSEPGCISQPGWKVKVFPLAGDPRTDEASFRAAAEKGIEATGLMDGLVETLDFQFGGGGPSDLPTLRNRPPLGDAVRDAKLPADHFGLVATAQPLIPAGRWRIRAVSDDGIRVKLDGKTVIERWTLHVPTEDEHVFTLAQEARVPIEVEYFELQGNAQLFLRIEPVPAEGGK